MIIKFKEDLYNRDGKLRWSEIKEVKGHGSGFTAQMYFNETHLKDMLDEDSDLGAVILNWQNKNYVFKRNKNDD